jgi:hypothetical protein
MNKQLTFLFSFTFLFLFSGSVYGGDFQDGKDAYDRKDYKIALKLWLPIAEQGDSKAQYNLGLMYANGWGVLQDSKEALNWYRLSAEQGNAFAQYNLGAFYLQGRGVSRDYVSAHMWFNLAGSNGFKYGVKYDLISTNIIESLGVESAKIVETIMTPSQIERAQRLARTWKPNKKIRTAESLPIIDSQPSTPHPLLFSGSVYGQEEVKKEYWDNGKLRRETHYKNGKLDGRQTMWRPSGIKSSETHWKNGKVDGLSTDWDEYGRKKISWHHKNGKAEGVTIGWYESGNKRFETSYKNDKKDGVYKKWYPSGKKKTLGHFKDDKENGVRKEWDEDGTLTFEGNYIDGAEEIK